MAEGGGFARRADGNHAIDAAFDLKLDELAEIVIGDLLILERRDERRDGAGELAEFHDGVGQAK